MDSKTSPRSRRVSTEERTRIVDLFEKSGLTKAVFAQQQGVKLATFQQWLYKLRPRQPRRKSFQEVPLNSLMGSTWAAELVLESGITLRLSIAAHPQWISSVLPLLRHASC